MDAFTLPSLISRATTDTYNIHQMIGMMQRLGIRAPIMLIGGIIITLTLDPLLTLSNDFSNAYYLSYYYVHFKSWYSDVFNCSKRVDDFIRVVREDITGIRVIKALSKEDYEKKKFNERNEATVVQEKKSGMVMSVLNPVMNLCLNVGTVLVILAGAYRVNSGAIKPGVIIAFLTYVTLILNALLFISRVFTNYSKASASAKRITEILNEKEELAIKDIPRIKTDYAIEFNNVSFSYNHKEENVSNITFGC